MTFLHPTLFAIGIASVAIPILIHLLLRQRRRPIQWAAMRFLMEAYRRQRRRMRVQQWLLLAARCLLLAALAAAIAQPLLERAGVLGSGRTLYVLIDNGLASGVREGDGSAAGVALERHKERAREMVRALGAGDRAALVTLAGPARGVVLPASADPAAVLGLIDDVQITDAPTDLAGALQLVATAAGQDQSGGGAGRPVIAVLSDFLQGSADVSRPLPTALADMPGVQVLAPTPRASAPGNVQVVSVEPLRAVVLTGTGGTTAGLAQREQVRVTLRRTGQTSEGGVTSVRLRPVGASGAGGPGAQQTVRWQPGQTEAVVAMQVDPAASESEGAGVFTALVAEIDRDALGGDNVYRRPIGVREALRVGIVARQRFGAASGIDRLAPADWIRLALAPAAGTPMDVSQIEPGALDAPVIAAHDVLFIPAPETLKDEDWPRLRRFVDNGGLLVVSPSVEETVHLWTDPMVRELGLSWRLARESSAFEQPMSLDDRAGDSPVLGLIAPEFASLARPVSVSRVLAIEDAGPSSDVMLSLASGEPWMIASEPGSASEAPAAASENGATRTTAPGRGMVVYLASAPALLWTDLPAKPLMVPLMQELCRQGFGRAAGTWSTAAGRSAAAPSRTVALRALSSDDAPAPAELAVAPSGLTAEPVRSAGLFTAVDDARRARGLVAVNADVDAGRTSTQEASAVQSWLAATAGSGQNAASVAWLDEQAPGAALARRDARSPIALPLLIAALVVAAAELVMARLFSHAVRRDSGATGPVDLADQVFTTKEAA